MSKAVVSFFNGGGIYWMHFWDCPAIGDLVMVMSKGMARRANQDENPVGVVIKTEVPLGCLGIFDEVVL